MRMYGITESDIEETLKEPDNSGEDGNRKIALKKFPERFSEFPLKVVYVVENEEVIISAYPLKKVYRRT